MKYKINEITPKAYQCALNVCPSIYEGIRGLTPEMNCGAAGCPSIHEGLKELTPKEYQCATNICPSTHEAKRKGKEVYLIVGKKINPKEAGLEKKVGKDEALIEVPIGLIDDMGK